MRRGQIWPSGIKISPWVLTRIFAGLPTGSSLFAEAFLEPDTVLCPNFSVALQQCLNVLF